MENQQSYINKQTVVSFILGIILVLFLYHAYMVYQLRSDLNYIYNQFIVPATQAQQTPTQQ